MKDASAGNWLEENQRHLTARLAVVREHLTRRVERARAFEQREPEAGAIAKAEHDSHGANVSHRLAGVLAVDNERLAIDAATVPPALEELAAAFGLSAFECNLLLLCAGVELDADFQRLCAEAQGDPRPNYPTFSLALSALPEPHWSALLPVAPLRRWRLVEVMAGDALLYSPLRIDERVLHYIVGTSYLDERLRGLLAPVAPPAQLTPSHLAIVRRVSGLLSAARHEGESLPAVLVDAAGGAWERTVAAASCAELGLQLYALRAGDIPSQAIEREALARLWEREAVLEGAALIVESEGAAGAAAGVGSFVEAVRGVVFVAGADGIVLGRRPSIRLDVPRPAASELRTLWHTALGLPGEHLNGDFGALVSHFDLGADAVHSVSAQARDALARRGAKGNDEGGAELESALWDACRLQARPHMEDLAQRIEPFASWPDLMLPEHHLQTLHEIASHVRQRARVYEDWEFVTKGSRGLGIAALFTGASGTGKTMAAEVLANELRLDLYRIDLSQVVSKYIGETEKNLRRIFERAEGGGAVLLFDEADALFGKRSEVKDSHDRYANIEVSYLLQRMEAYRGLAILTTNMKAALDSSFMRRLRFVLHFPFPDQAQRSNIWRSIFPSGTPTNGIDYEKLARLNIAGGQIRNIALHAAFLAAEQGQPVGMAHLLRAAHGEYTKLEKPLTGVEFKDWL